MEKEKILMTESTEKIFNELVTVDIENMTPVELVNIINSTGKLNATLKESGEIKIRQVLLG